MSKFKFVCSIFALSALSVACSDDDTEMIDSDAGIGGPSFSVTFNGLTDLGADYVYEGWVIIDGSPVSSGRFSSDGSDGQMIAQTLSEDADPSAYILTIEPATGDDPGASDVHVVGGDFSNRIAELSIDHGAALGDDFTGAAGTFILATPSSAAMDDDAQGIWFLDPAGGPGPSLTLPTLPSGWIYEGWVVDGNGPVSTGTFTSADMADSNGAGPGAGTDGAMPPFPGEDFITPPRDLSTGHTAVISIEPVPDNSPMPFQLKPLALEIDGASVGGANPQTLGNAIANNTITGTATITK